MNSKSLIQLGKKIGKSTPCKRFLSSITDDIPSKKIGILGAPFELGQPFNGIEKSTTELRDGNYLVDKLRCLGHDVKDYGDLAHQLVEESTSEPWTKNNPMNPKNVIQYNKMLSEKISEIIKDGRIPLTLGGDHSISLGTVSAHLKQKSDACVLWVDAHSDINTPATAASGHMHGMPISFQIPSIYKDIKNVPSMVDWHTPRLDPGKIAYIGLRDVEPEEREFIKKYKIPSYSMKEVDQFGIQDVVKRALKNINPDNSRPLHVSFDIDVLDPMEAPSTGTLVRGGLTLREGMSVLEHCFHTGTLSGIDLVEINTALGNLQDGQRTVEAGKLLILAAFGYYRGGSTTTNLSPHF